MGFAICFSNKKNMIDYVKYNHIYKWYFVNNKKDIPKNITEIVGNNICKDYRFKENNFVMKNSLKDRRK